MRGWTARRVSEVLNGDDLLVLQQQVVGAAMLSDGARMDMGDVTGTHFPDPRCKALWELMQRMEQDGTPIDPTTVRTRLTSLPEDAGRVTTMFIADCVSHVNTVSLGPVWAATLVNEYELRAIESAAVRAHTIVQGAEKSQDAYEQAVDLLTGAAPGVDHSMMLADTIDDTIAGLGRPTKIIPTPWHDLNQLIRGWRPGALYVVGARPGAGKTILGLQAAVHLSQHGPVAVNSLEMPASEVHKRILAHTGRVAIQRLDGAGEDAAPLSDFDKQKIKNVLPALRDLALSIDDRSSITVTAIRAHARGLSRRGQLAGVVVDYLQLMTSERGDRRPRHEIVADQSRQLKILAKELQCPVIALSQLNRASEQREGKAPTLSDLRESGALEQDADVVLLLHVPVDKSPDGLEIPIDHLLRVTVAKNRHGPVGRVTLARHGETATLLDEN